jgi:cytochrome c5
MKKKLVAFLLAGVMALSFAVPAMANTVVAQETVVEATYQEIAPLTERTVIYHRVCVCCHRLQFRVWGATSMRWLTDWLYI